MSRVETAEGIPFSEPPNVIVSSARSHCEACKEPLDPNVMHKCDGNKHYEPPVFSSTEITELCPACLGEGVLVERETFQAKTFVVVCKSCRTYVWPEVTARAAAIYSWNSALRDGSLTGWPKWLAELPGDDERTNIIPNLSSARPSPHPDLTNYQGVCPKCYGGRGLVINADTGETPICDLCENTGTVPPTKSEDAQ